MPHICAISTHDSGSIAPKAVWYRDNISMQMSVDTFENAQMSCDWQSTLTTASRRLIRISWKHMDGTIRTFNTGPLAARAI